MTLFIRLLDVPLGEKSALLRDATQSRVSRQYDVDPAEFIHLPGCPFAYWVSNKVRQLFMDLPRFDDNGRAIKQGVATADDFRFVRAWWETDTRKKNKVWFSFAKGGVYSPFYADLHLDVNWERNGAQISVFADPITGKVRSRPQNTEFYFRPGLTWSDRTTKRFSARVWPRGGVFSVKGSAGFFDGQEFFASAIMNSSAFCGLINMLVGAGDAAARSYQVGVIGAVPYPRFDPHIAELAKRAWSLKRTLDRTNECSHAFLLPAPLCRKVCDFDHSRLEGDVLRVQSEIDAAAFALYGLDAVDIVSIEAKTSEESAEPWADIEDDDSVSGDDDADEDEDEDASAPGDSSAVLSWAIGVVFGRFDIRLAINEREIPPEPDPFESLPVISPGMLPTDGSSFMTCGGVLVDDPGHTDDLASRVTAVYEHVGEQAPEHAILRATLAREFFSAHVKTYSKSRRKAPIYWQLATPSANYSVWLYIHAFSKDTLFRVQNEYVAHKLAYERRQLAGLRAETGPNPNSAQRNAIEAQEGFVEELQSFLDEVRRIAPLWNPDLDDGVIINFAPLWRLVPQNRAWQKELRTAWGALVRGNYDWSHLAMHLWPERVVPKCAIDRSLAIAHSLEDVFWFKDDDDKWKAREKPVRSIDEIVKGRTSPAVKDALRSLMEAPETVGVPKRGRKRAA